MAAVICLCRTWLWAESALSVDVSGNCLRWFRSGLKYTRLLSDNKHFGNPSNSNGYHRTLLVSISYSISNS